MTEYCEIDVYKDTSSNSSDKNENLEEPLNSNNHPKKRNTKKDDDGFCTNCQIFKYAQTICLISTWMSMAFMVNITGPALQDLVIRLKTDYAHISSSVAFGGLGNAAGAIIGCPIADLLVSYSYLTLGLTLLLMSTANILIPWSLTVIHVGVGLFIIQGGVGIINVVGQKLCLSLWGKNAAVPMHGLHAGFSIGSLIVAQLALPFLSKRTLPSVYHLQTTGNNTKESLINTTKTETDPYYYDDSNIEWAYAIITMCSSVNATMLIILQYLSKRNQSNSVAIDTTRGKLSTVTMNQDHEELINKKATWRDCVRQLEILDPRVCSPDGNRIYSVMMLILLFIYWCQMMGCECMFGTYVASYSKKGLNFSNKDAANLNSLFFLGHAFGRVSVFIVGYWTPKILLVAGESCLNLIVILIMFLFPDNADFFWGITFCMGFVVSPLFPSGLTWANHYLRVTGALIMLLMLAAGTGFIYLTIVGAHFDEDPFSLIKIMLVCGCILLMVAIVTQVAGSTKGPLSKFQMAVTDEISIIIEDDIHRSNQMLALAGSTVFLTPSAISSNERDLDDDMRMM